MEKLDRIEQVDEFCAAVIVEPVIDDDSIERIRWLKDLRDRCTKKGVVLIFDEVITGLRYKKYGVSNCYGILPDLICLGKALANGMPLACVGGRKDLMSGDYFISSTYAGDILSLAACKATLSTVMTHHSYNIEHLWEMGRSFLERFNKNNAGVSIKGYATRGVFQGEPAKIAMFFQEMGRANTLFCKSWFYNWALAEHNDSILDIAQEALFRISKGQVALEYPLPRAPYAEQVRRTTT